MLIILEGTDGAGKTTLANHLVAKMWTLGVETEVIHAGPPEPGLSVFHQYSLPLLERREKIARRNYLLILDRWHLGELIYGPILRGKSALEPEQFAYLELLLESLGTVKVIVNATDGAIRARLGAHRKDLVSVEQAIDIKELFLSLAVHYPSWQVETPEVQGRDDLTTDLMKWMVHDNLAAQVLSKIPGYVGSVHPNLLLVGDEPSGWKVGDLIRPAFFPDVRGSSSNYLLRSLLANQKLLDVGFCNANDGTEVKYLWRLLDYPMIVALGNKASTTLHRLNLDHAVVPHPQWVRRFHHRSHEAYGRAILAPELELRVLNGELVATSIPTREVG